jgi:predicted O-methyltransferase YrrM
MNYYYHDRFNEHWKDIEIMIEENYSEDYDDDTGLVLSVNLLFDIHRKKKELPKHKKLIAYQLEPIINNHWWDFNEMIDCLKEYDEVWDYDLNNIEILKKNGIDAKYKPFVYSKNLKRIKNAENPDIDILFYGTITEHRNEVMTSLICYYLPYTFNIVRLNNVTGDLLDHFISRSKIILDLSNNGSSQERIQKQSRIYYALINDKCVISEKSDRNYFGDLIKEFDIEQSDQPIELTEILCDYLINDKWKEYTNVSEKFKFMSMKNMKNDKSKNKKFIEILQEFDIDGESLETGGTDKNTRHSYIEVYQKLLEPLIDKEGSLLEIGMYSGGSIILWNEFLPKFKIFGLDIKDQLAQNCREYVENNSDKIKLNFIDAYTEQTTNHIKSINPDGFDVIIDDGPHTEESQVDCIRLYLDLLKEDGMLIIEDIQDFSSIEVLKESIPTSDYFDYEIEVYDHRGIKSRYGDVLFLIKKTKRKKENKKVFIITPCTRPFNLQTISQSIPKECEWIVVLDNSVKHEHNVDNAVLIKSPHTGFRGYTNKNYALDYIQNNLNPSDDDWIIILHDDNIIHPNWWESISQHLNSEYSMIIWGQCRFDGSPKINAVDSPKIGNIDTSQYMIKWNVSKNIRFKEVYEADGIFAEEIARQSKVLKIDEYLGYYNYLRSHKSDREIGTNICMISMFKNEAKGIRRMLESVWRHIDFYVFQDNGSTDGTPEIVKEFFADKNIPGFIYKVEEGWVGFGWNRDHLLQTTLQNDYGCDWIMKMDCDEYLEVDDDFDWSYFHNTNIESFHVTAMAPGCIYYRAWIWNANLPWHFQHDPAHEIIYLEDKGDNFERVNLPRGLRMIGTNDGESYTVRTKYISDALKLEEKMIRQETMLTDTYHFWYIAKSYHDCHFGNFYPLGEAHSKEFTRRFIFYFEEYLKFMNASGIHEMSYFSAFSIGLGYKYLGEIDKAIEWFKKSEKYCPVRNEHIVYLAQTYAELGQYEKMLEQTFILVDPNRKLPFPDYYFLIDTNLYQDSGTYPQELHNYALSKVKENQKTINSFSVNASTKPRLWIVDDFYDDPHAVRDFALQQEFEKNLDYYKGNRSKNQFIVPGTKEAFEKIIGKKITNWTETHGMCGRFQYCTAQDDLVYHCDGQTLAGMVYLTPDAPVSCGTSLFAHKKTGMRNENDFGNINVFEGGYYDRTKFELVDTAGNVFNRLVLFDAKCIHSANEYFGTDLTNSRLFHLFFFD